MKRSVLVLLAVMSVGSASRVGAAQEGASKPQPEEQKKTSPSPAPEQASTPEAKRAAARVPGSATTVKRPRYLKAFVGEFRALDLDKKTLSFQTDAGKSYTVEAQVPGMVEAKQRAAELAQILQPGDKIRMVCRVNEKEEPVLILSLHMIGDKAPLRYR